MIKNIMILSLFVVSWAISAMEESEPVLIKMEKPEFIELDCSTGVNSTCKGRCYEKKTKYNAISPCDQSLWTFYDPVMDVVDPCQDPAIYDEYNALKVHTCSINVIKKGIYFTNRINSILITKFEFNRKNNFPKRVLNTFFGQLISSGKEQDKIYAWVNKKEKILIHILGQYYFKKSQENIFVPNKNVEVFRFDSGIIQLEANKKDIYTVLF
jgi:hypothetical protein